MFGAMLVRTSTVLSLFLLAGCLAQSDIQAKYMASQSDCRQQTAHLFAARADGTTSPEQGQQALASGFSDCMNKSGWHLATGKPIAVVNNPPTGSPSTNPSAALRVQPTQNSAVQPTQAPVGRTASQSVPASRIAESNPPTGSPSTQPSAAAVSSGQTGTAVIGTTQPVPAVAPAPSPGTGPLSTYQPGRPENIIAPTYSGGGRNF